MTPAVKNFAIQRTGEHDYYSTVQFLKPGLGPVSATFHILPAKIAELCAQANREGKLEPLFNVDVIDEQGEVVATVEKRLYIRKKR